MSDHYPVMLNEVLENLSPHSGGVYVDGTFGAGGYSKAILELADCTVIGIDRDPNAQSAANDLKDSFGERFIFIHGCFGDALELVNAAGFKQVDGFVLDLGVSSMQLDQAERGFSFRFDGPLDMRMGQEGQSAADLVNSLEEEELANIIYKYGEERLSRRIAKNIVKERSVERIETTERLAEIVRAVVPRSPKDKIDPATRTFQALRIAVNDELGELERGLEAAEALLKDQGRLVVVSFHSLEDGIVKSFMYERSGYVPNMSRHLPPAQKESHISFSLLKRKPTEPLNKEVKENSRSRSAKLRLAIRKKEQTDV
jgi:16S rRNA (cytosine1402-N4)-methyltransferase